MLLFVKVSSLTITQSCFNQTFVSSEQVWLWLHWFGLFRDCSMKGKSSLTSVISVVAAAECQDKTKTQIKFLLHSRSNSFESSGLFNNGPERFYNFY